MAQKIIVMGNLGADPETRTTAGGTTVCNLRVAVSEKVKKGDTWVDETEWFRVVCFGKTAEQVAKFCTKGRAVWIEGKIRTNKWEDKEGATRYTTELIADKVTFLGGGKKGEDAPDSYSDPGADGDIPF